MKQTRRGFIYRLPENKDGVDFYKTPSEAVEILFRVEKFKGIVWECCSGDGTMSKIIEKYNKCISSDIRVDNSIYGEKGVDFLSQTRRVDNIITNPPFSYALEFVLKSKSLAKVKVALFLRIQFLESKSRYNMYQDKKFPLKKVYVFSKRIRFEGKTKKKIGQVAYAWFIWEKNYRGKPYLDWILL